MTRSARIAIIVPVVSQFDAIGAAAVDLARHAAALPNAKVTLFSLRADDPVLGVTRVDGVADLLAHRDYCEADALVFSFGVYSPLFDAILVGNGHGRRVVQFHNVTPAGVAAPHHQALIERSFVQMHNIAHADEVWAVSEINAAVLRDAGIISGSLMRVLPLQVEGPARQGLLTKPAPGIRIAFVGRFVRSKGVLDLIEAFAALPPRQPATQLALAGNLEFSDPSYVAALRERLSRDDLAERVHFLGTIEDSARDALYAESHILGIPSYHEGFCKPVVEGLRAGCIPVGYAAYNLPCIAGGLGRLVPSGDVAALTAALADVVAGIVAARDDPARACLPLDGGAMTPAAFDAAVDAHVAQFSPVTAGRALRRRLSHLLSLRRLVPMRPIRPIFTVLPDDEARERERVSLNRLPDLLDWEAGGQLSDLMRELRQPVTIHRKSWEYAICVSGLAQLGATGPDTASLAVGAGSETPLFHYANTLRRMVATDLYNNPDHEGTPAMLVNPAAFAPFPYRQDRLEVLRMPGDALDFPDATFDSVFCLSSIEHFGSRATQARALDEMARVLKPGGIACIITELILTDDADAEYFRWEELDAMFLHHPRLRLVGGAPDLTISESLVAYPVDIEHTAHPNRSPHIVLRRGDMLWTSFSMFLERLPAP